MRHETRQALNDINRAFYREAAASFSATREAPWPGWERLIHAIEELGLLDGGAPLRIMDVGCGNGRFARFLADRLPGPLSYVGLDASEPLLARAAEDTRELVADPGYDLLFETWDFVEEPFPTHLQSESFEVINLSGVMHHVPSFELRRELLHTLHRSLAPGGLLVLALWQFAAEGRFAKKLIPREAFAEHLGTSGLEVPDVGDLEEGDYLLPWGAEGRSLRYCHQVDAAETRRIIDELPLSTFQTYEADGREGRLNRYVLLR